jgi:hypothetical protein
MMTEKEIKELYEFEKSNQENIFKNDPYGMSHDFDKSSARLGLLKEIINKHETEQDDCD